MLNSVFPDNRNRLSPALLLVCLVFITGISLNIPYSAHAGEWRVTPIRIFFDRGARIGTVNVQNDGDAPMNFQVKAMEWTQDAEGKDQYAEMSDLIYFPKLLTIPPREERVIRIGLKGLGGASEKTYRLFVEEISPPRKDGNAEGATVAVNVRFAVPLFVAPLKEQPNGQLLKTELDKGIISSTLRNTGNVHFRLLSLKFQGRSASGEVTFSQTVDGWYLLNGTTRTFSSQIPVESCRKTSLIEVEGTTDRKFAIKGNVVIDSNQCQ
jgi:fimbrial chaperone protein